MKTHRFDKLVLKIIVTLSKFIVVSLNIHLYEPQIHSWFQHIHLQTEHFHGCVTTMKILSFPMKFVSITMNITQNKMISKRWEMIFEHVRFEMHVLSSNLSNAGN